MADLEKFVNKIADKFSEMDKRFDENMEKQRIEDMNASVYNKYGANSLDELIEKSAPNHTARLASIHEDVYRHDRNAKNAAEKLLGRTDSMHEDINGLQNEVADLKKDISRMYEALQRIEAAVKESRADYRAEQKSDFGR